MVFIKFVHGTISVPAFFLDFLRSFVFRKFFSFLDIFQMKFSRSSNIRVIWCFSITFAYPFNHLLGDFRNYSQSFSDKLSHF